MDSFIHHSRQFRFRSPQGACRAGTPWRVFCAAEGIWAGARVTLRLWRDETGEERVPMRRTENGFEAELILGSDPGLLWYYFILELPNGEIRYYGGRSGEGAFFDHEPPAFRVTVFNGAFETPEWFREGICYQIFPDRFRRSSWEDFYARVQAHTARGRQVRIHDRWSETPLITPGPGRKDYAPDDYFGGDFNGIRSKLDYLASMGVTCIYLNPIFEAASNHRYNTADYMHVDPILGSDEEFELLCAEARAHGIRIMLDGVFSHTGSDSIYFNREGLYGENTGAYRDKLSPYRKWYRFNETDGTYECWWNFISLPNVEETDPDYIRFIAGEDGVLSRWARAGATSWRLDVADELPDEFIRILRDRIKRNDPEGVLLGEVWEDPTSKRGPNGRRGYVNGDELDSVMNYGFRNAVLDYLSEKISAPEFADEMLFMQEQYPKPFYDAALNLLSSHDVVRALTVLADAPGRDELTREEQETWRPSEENRARARRRMPLAVALQAFLPGVPCLYYGDEAGMEGMADPFNRGTYPWGREDKELVEVTRKLFLLRRAETALRRGGCRMAALDGAVFAAVRTLEKDRLLLLINPSEQTRTVTLSGRLFNEGRDGSEEPLTGMWRDTDGCTYSLKDDETVTVAPLSFRIWKKMDGTEENRG